MTRWEIFHVTDGAPLVTLTAPRFVARAVVAVLNWAHGGGHDYARPGEGW